MLFTLATSARAQLVESPGAAESLLKRMEAAYTALASYSDVTAVKYRNPDGSDRSTVEFKMWFARPARFRADAQTTRPDGSPPKRTYAAERASTMKKDGAMNATPATVAPPRPPRTQPR